VPAEANLTLDQDLTSRKPDRITEERSPGVRYCQLVPWTTLLVHSPPPTSSLHDQDPDVRVSIPHLQTALGI